MTDNRHNGSVSFTRRPKAQWSYVAAMADKDKQKSVQDLMAGQPGAQSLHAVALENIRARRKRLLGDEIATAPATDTIQPEPCLRVGRIRSSP